MAGDGSSAALERAWCCVCRRSSDVKWPKHAFTSGHRQRAVEFLKQRSTALSELLAIPKCDASSGVAGLLQAMAARKWSCGFCELYDLEGWRACVDHFAGEAHRKTLEAFCRHHRCDVDRKLRVALQLTPGKQRQLVKAFGELQQREAHLRAEEYSVAAAQVQHAESGAASDLVGARAEAFLSSAAARLQQVQASQQPRATASSPAAPVARSSTMAPRPPVADARMETVESADGILQNPLGMHEGRRVWGGGIVKHRKPNEWIPWPIDLLVKAENDRVAAGGVVGNTQLYQDLHRGDAAGDDHVFFSHRVTDMAFGAGLERISKVTWGDSVANVHTAAVPPWMVQSEEEYKRCNQRQLPLNGSTGLSVQDTWTPQPTRHDLNGPTETRASTGDQGAIERKDDTPSQASAVNDPNWLPNFGGVWQEGSRSKTKHEFAKTMLPRAPALQFRPASVYQRRRQATPSQPAPSTPSVSIQPTPGSGAAATPEATVLSPTPVEATKAPANPMDEKKRLLLAQKERLRAKIAAKRAPVRE